MKITLDLSDEEYSHLKYIKKTELKEFISEIFDFGYKIKFPNIDIDSEYSTNSPIISNDDNNKILQKYNQLDEMYEKIYGLSMSSNKKGEISEKFIENLIQKRFPNYNYVPTRTTAHSGDGILEIDQGENYNKIMVEIKNYNHSVDINEVNKFMDDLITKNITIGIFISIKTSISNHKPFDFMEFTKNEKKYFIIFISNINEEMSRLEASFLLAINILNIIKKNNNVIDKDIINAINEIENIIDDSKKIKNNFNVLENCIVSSLNTFHKELRDYEYELEKKIKQLIFKVNLNNSSQINLDQFSKHKDFHLLNKILDIIKENNIQIQNIENDENSFNLFKNNEEIGNIKKQKNKTLIKIESLLLTFDEKNKFNEKNFNIFKQILNNS